MLNRCGFIHPGQRWKHCINTLLTGGVLFIVSASAHADTSGYSIPGYELVYDAPVETTLTAPDLRPSDAVWISLFDKAQHTIELVNSMSLIRLEHASITSYNICVQPENAAYESACCLKKKG